MSLLDTLTADMKVAMKARESERLTTIRMLMSGLKNQQIKERGELSADTELSYLATEAKRRRESIEAFEAAGREDLAKVERAELVIIEAYLPKQLSADEVRDILKQVIADTGATSMGDMGRVMGAVMPKLKGRFPGKDVRPLLQDLLKG